jgi:hypothetical protein
MTIFSRIGGSFLLGATLLVHGCAAVQVVSEQSVENKIAKVKLGVTTKADIENLLGNEHGAENLRWVYNLSDSAWEISEQKTGMGAGIFPLSVATTDTRALITVHFTESGTVNGLEVERFFNPPFINDYWYLIKKGAENILKSAERAAETSNFRVVGFDNSAGRFALEGALSKTQVTVILEKQILHITSVNPYGRLTNEYRVFTKREGAFIDKILALTAGEEPPWLQADANAESFTPNSRRPRNITGNRPTKPFRKHDRAPTRSPKLVARPPPTVQPVAKAAHLTWKDNSDNESGFRIYRITGRQKIMIAELGPNSTSYTDKDAPPKACYEVTAFNSVKESFPTNKVCLPD